MNFTEYQDYFQTILHSEQTFPPYDNPDYLNYTKLNWSRMNRWLKTGHLTEEFKQVILGISETQNWIVITEPWCGDAAHIVPFLHLAAELNNKIKIVYELRDSEPHRINNYLTNGKSKSIPKLVIYNADGNDLAVWGPRPVACQKVYDELHAQNADFETVKTQIQHWYNNDAGHEIMLELSTLLRSITY